MGLDEDRIEWEKEALTVVLPDTISTTKDEICGVSCLWVVDKRRENERVILYVHGGGLVAGSAITHRNIAATLAMASGSSVLLVNYRLLPEHQYPAPLDDVLNVYRSLITDLKYDPSELIFGGDSSGGGLVLAALVYLKDKKVPLPSCAFSVSGAFDMTLTSESMRLNQSTEPHMSSEQLKKWRDDYLQYDLKSPLLSPLFADLSGLPKILLLVGGQDPWRCDSESLAKKIKAVGGKASLVTWQSMGHVWVMNAELDESRKAVNVIADFICANEGLKK